MKFAVTISLSVLAIIGVASSSTAMAQSPNAGTPAAPGAFPSWAYPWAPAFKSAPDDGVPRHVPDSKAAFTITQERDLFFAPDWHPEDHPAMPDVVAHGRAPDVRACGSCHRAEGTGGPENANLSGLPAAYIVQQLADYKSGARKFAGPPRSPNVVMTAIAKAMNDDEMKAAAGYFSSLKSKSFLRVIEADTVPKTQIARVFYSLSKDGGTEPIGERIVEVPDDIERFEHRDTRSTFTAYVPKGSIAKGEVLAKTGGSGITIPCAGCHGPDLKGIAAIPGIAGRSPSYLVRQLYDIQQHARAGTAAALMAPVVEKLSHDDMISLAAYVSSLKP